MEIKDLKVLLNKIKNGEDCSEIKYLQEEDIDFILMNITKDERDSIVNYLAIHILDKIKK